MKLTKNILRENRIHNPYNIAKRANSKLFIDYSPQQLGRAYHNAKWQVVGINFHTDLNAHWADYSNKTFDIYRREDKQPQLDLAMAWCKEQYGIEEWEKDVFGSYHPKGTLEIIIRVLAP